MSEPLEQHNQDTLLKESFFLPIVGIDSESIILDKKVNRRQRYEFWDGELNEELFQKLRQKNILEFDPKKTVYDNKYKKSPHYQGNLFWNQENLDSLLLKEDDCTRIKSFLIPKEDITYDEAEAILAEDPNLLVCTMTLLVNNYLWAIKKIEDNLFKDVNIDEEDLSFLPILFTDEEEKTFFTGRTLLVELNKCVNSPYVDDLIIETDGIILTFNSLLVAGLVYKHNIYLEKKDSFQEGCIGLLKSLEDFDIDRNVKFSTYATWWIKQKIKKADSDQGNLIRIPRKLGDEISKISREVKTEYKMNPEYSRQQILEEILKKHIPSKRKGIKAAMKSLKIFSLDRNNNPEDDDNPLLDRVASKPNEVEELEDTGKKEVVQLIIDSTDLTPRERGVVECRFRIKQPSGEIMTFKEIGKKQGLTAGASRRILIKAIKKIRETSERLGLKEEDIL